MKRMTWHVRVDIETKERIDLAAFRAGMFKSELIELGLLRMFNDLSPSLHIHRDVLEARLAQGKTEDPKCLESQAS